MFSGIIKLTGKIGSIVPANKTGIEKGFLLTVDSPGQKISLGESIAVDGVCLTVIKKKSKKSRIILSMDVSEETAKKTTLGKMKTGQEVNLERPLKVGDALGGHFVQGHVDAEGKIHEILLQGNSKLYWFSHPAFLEPFIVPKGSIAVDGISLTVVELREQVFSISVLPFTETSTALKNKKVGDEVNLETDILVKTIVREMERIRGKFFSSAQLYQKMDVEWEDLMREEGYK